MGAGKTTVGKLLAEKLKLEYIDMDKLAMQISRYNSIDEIFDKAGEIAFRELEIAAAKKVRNTKNIVIATGGGVIMNKIIIEYLKEDSIIVFLKTSFEETKKRVASNPPYLFRNIKNAQNLYTLRLPLYHYYANKTVITDNKTPEEVVEEIYKNI